jgi:hypothetical protein
MDLRRLNDARRSLSPDVPFFCVRRHGQRSRGSC